MGNQGEGKDARHVHQNRAGWPAAALAALAALSGCGAAEAPAAATVTEIATETVTATVEVTATVTETVAAEQTASDEEIAELMMGVAWGGMTKEEQFDVCLDYHWDEQSTVNAIHREVKEHGVTKRMLEEFLHEEC